MGKVLAKISVTSDIIANISVSVNIVGQAVSDSGAERNTDKIVSRWSMAKAGSRDLARVAMMAGDFARATKIRACADVVEARRCADCGVVHMSKMVTCQQRLCPMCAARNARIRGRQAMAEVIAMQEREEVQGAHWVAVTLTVRNCKAVRLRGRIGEMLEAWQRLMQRKVVRDPLLGWVRSLEVTYNRETDTYHPHIHALLVMREDYREGGKWKIETADWVKLWRQSLRLTYDPIAYAQSANDADIDAREIVKYATKPAMVTQYKGKDGRMHARPDGEAVAVYETLTRALDGRHLVAYGGIWAEVRRELDNQEDAGDADDDQTHDDRCKRCGGPIEDVVYRWMQGEYREVEGYV